MPKTTRSGANSRYCVATMSRYVGYYVYECDAPLCGETATTVLRPSSLYLPTGWSKVGNQDRCPKHREKSDDRPDNK